MKTFAERYGMWVVKHRWWVIAATVVVVALCAMGGGRLTANNDNRIFFSKENPQLVSLEALESTYTKDENVFLAVHPHKGDLFTSEALAALDELTRMCWQIPYSSRVDSMTNFQHTRVEGDELIVEDLVRNARALKKEEIADIRRIALSEPLLVNRLISKTGHVAGINVNIIKPEDKTTATNEIVVYVRQIIKDFSHQYPEMDIHLTGWIMLENALGEASQEDMQVLVPIMFIVLIIILGIALRSVAGTGATLIVIIFSMLTGMGLAGWWGIAITAPSSNAPPIILTLAVADSIHFLVTMFYLMRQGKDKHSAIVESLRVNMQSVFLTSLTTAIGFLTMNFSDAPPFRDVGNIVAAGVTAAFFYSMGFLPALMAVIPVRVKSRQSEQDHGTLQRFADFVIRRRQTIMVGTVAVSAVLALGVLRIELDDDFIKYFDERYEFRQDSDFIMKHLTGLYTIEYSLNSGKPDGIHDPVFLKTVEKFATWYKSQPHFVHVNTLTDTIKRLNRDMHNNDPTYYRIPDDRQLAAQYLLLYEMSLPFGLDLNNQINVDRSSIRMTVTLRDITARQLRDTDTRAREWLKANASESMFTYGTGLGVIYAHISSRNIKSMLAATTGAIILISLILALVFKSLKFGLVSMVPNLVPVLMAFGLWGLVVRQVGLPISVLAALTLGIIVDDTVHFINKYLHARREGGLSPAEAVRYTFNTVGTAIWVTTAALVGGFWVLAISGFKPSSDMGLMTGVTIALALVFDFLLLPTLLMKVEEKSYEKVNREHDAYFAPVSLMDSGSDT
jgi:predicted RND superfamily exporter protein